MRPRPAVQGRGPGRRQPPDKMTATAETKGAYFGYLSDPCPRFADAARTPPAGRRLRSVASRSHRVGRPPYHELGDLIAAIPILGLVDQAEALERGLRRVAHSLETETGEAVS